MARTKHFKEFQDFEMEPVQERKSSRTKMPDKAPDTSTTLFDPWGGHLFLPPISCNHAFQTEDGGRWTDLGCCNACEDKCQRYIQYFSMKPDEQKAWLKTQGVKHQD